MKKEEHCNFHFFWKIIAPLKAKMMKNENDKNMINKWKNSRKIAIFHFFGIICTIGSKHDEKLKYWLKNDKNMIKNMIKTL